AGDLHGGERLAVAGLAAVALAAAILVDEQLGPAAVGDHLRGDLGAFQRRLADLHVLTVGDQEHLAERDRAAGVDRLAVVLELLDVDRLARLDPVLLAACRNHRVHEPTPWRNRGAKSTRFDSRVNRFLQPRPAPSAPGP